METIQIHKLLLGSIQPLRDGMVVIYRVRVDSARFRHVKFWLG
jgi:hypothetical protein